MINHILQECTNIVKDLVGNEYLYFDSPIEVKLTPHTPSFLVWGVCISPANKLYAMDNNEEWHEVAIQEGNAHLVIGSLYQRLKMMQTRYAKAS